MSIQQRLPGTTDDAGWRPVSGELAAVVVVDSAVSAAGLGTADPATPLWTGSVRLPHDRAPGQYRVLIAERQLLLSDVQQAYSWVVVANPADYPVGATLPPPQRIQDTYHPGSPRLIFAETFPV